MVITVHGGHAASGKAYCGAVGLLDESVEDRLVKDALIKYLRQAGATAYDCTVDTGTSQRNVLEQICAKCNAIDSDLDISVHLNSERNDYIGDGKQGGFEIYATAYTGIKLEVATRMVNKMQSLGFGLHGKPLKPTSGLYFLNHTNAPALLLEICFVDDKDDYDLYKKIGADAIGRALAEAILNETIGSSSTFVPSVPVAVSSTFTKLATISAKGTKLTSAKVQLYESNGTDAQKWIVYKSSDGKYMFQNVACGLFLDVYGAYTASGTMVQAYEGNNSIAQQWKIEANGNYKRIVPCVNTALSLDNYGNTNSNGNTIQTYTNNTSGAQQWKINEVATGVYTFINPATGKVLDVYGGGQIASAPTTASNASATSSASSSTSDVISTGLTHAKNFTGYVGSDLSKAKGRVLQKALNLDYNAGLAEDGVIQSKSKGALGSHYVKKGEKQYMVTAAEILMMLNGIDPNGVESPGVYGNGLVNAAKIKFGDSGEKITADKFLKLVQ